MPKNIGKCERCTRVGRLGLAGGSAARLGCSATWLVGGSARRLRAARRLRSAAGGPTRRRVAARPDGDEPHEQGHICAPSGAVSYGKDWDGIGRATDKVTASLRLLHRARSMVGTSRWWTMKWPVAAVGFLTTAMGATPDGGHKYIRRLRALTAKHMGDLWAAQVARRREENDSEVMADLRRQWEDVRRFMTRMPTWTAVAKTHVFRIRNLFLK